MFIQRSQWETTVLFALYNECAVLVTCIVLDLFVPKKRYNFQYKRVVYWYHIPSIETSYMLNLSTAIASFFVQGVLPVISALGKRSVCLWHGSSLYVYNVLRRVVVVSADAVCICFILLLPIQYVCNVRGLSDCFTQEVSTCFLLLLSLNCHTHKNSINSTKPI